MKITMTLTLPYDNEIQFFDACKGAIGVLETLVERALDDGDLEVLMGHHEVVTANDDAEVVGKIVVAK